MKKNDLRKPNRTAYDKPTVLLVPMDVESVQRNESGTVSVHGYVGDYGVTFHASAEDYARLLAILPAVGLADDDPGDRCTIICALPDGHDGPCRTAEEIEGCRCLVCDGGNDDPAGIRGRQ